MTDTEILDAIIRFEIRLVRRVGEDSSFEWCAYNNAHAAYGKDLRPLIETFYRLAT